MVDAAIKYLETRTLLYRGSGIYPIREVAAEYLAHTLRVEVSPENIPLLTVVLHNILCHHDVWGIGGRNTYPNPGFPIYESGLGFRCKASSDSDFIEQFSLRKQMNCYP